MIHSMSGGVIREYENLIYCFVLLENGEKRWYKSPFIFIKVGDKVKTPQGAGEVLRVENVTAQTAPYPVSRTPEIVKIL